MDPSVRKALTLDRSSTAEARTVDITTIGRKTGLERRIEIWFHQVDGRWYLSASPGKPSWYANLKANPQFTVHLKHGVRADLAATAIPITDDAERRRVFTAIVDDINQPHNPAGIQQPTAVDDWMVGSPLIEIVFDEV